jgi:hypothetical protein
MFVWFDSIILSGEKLQSVIAIVFIDHDFSVLVLILLIWVEPPPYLYYKSKGKTHRALDFIEFEFIPANDIGIDICLVFRSSRNSFHPFHPSTRWQKVEAGVPLSLMRYG